MLYNLPAIVVANGLGAALTLLLVVSNRRNMRNSFFDDQLFFSMCLMGMFMCVLETASYFVDGAAFPGARSLSVTVNAILFMGSALCAFLWAAYVECKLFGRVPGLLSYTALPALAVCLMAALNLFFPVFFSVSPDNVYQRQPLAAASYLVVYGYLLWGTWQVFRYRRKAGGYLFMPVMVFLAPIFIASPIDSLYFLIFVLVLQQLDGNVIGPKILGDSTGLSSFWVIFAVTFFGGLWGFLGMLVGVPLFAVIYSLIRRWACYRLQRKGMPTDTHSFASPENQLIIKKPAARPPEEKGEKE